MSKNRDYALEKLADLSVAYNSVFKKLLAATDSNVNAAIKDEVRLGKEIWFYGKVAFGKDKADQLYLMRPVSPAEEAEMRALSILPPATPEQIASGLSVCSTAAKIPLAGTCALSEEHRQAMMACVWRGRRLSALLREADSAPTRGKGRRLYDAYCCIRKEEPDIGEEGWRAKACKAIGGSRDDMRKAIDRYGVTDVTPL